MAKVSGIKLVTDFPNCDHCPDSPAAQTEYLSNTATAISDGERIKFIFPEGGAMSMLLSHVREISYAEMDVSIWPH
jgi:hypothetical protein